MNMLRRASFLALSMLLSPACAKPGCPPRGANPAGISTGATNGTSAAPGAPAAPRSPAVSSPTGERGRGGEDGRATLREGWRIASSARVKDGGAAIATAGYRDGEWYVARVPNTVLAALVAAGVYPDPYKDDNLRRIPAAEFARSWWYRREFELAAAPVGQRVWLGFDGINYRANIWLNGKLVASEKDVRGTYRTYRFDVTDFAWKGKNALAVEVFRPGPDDLAINWWDWVVSPPDLNMGLFQDVFVRQTGPVLLEDLRLTTRVMSPARAEVTVTALVTNATDQTRNVTVAVSLGNRAAKKDVVLPARESKKVIFDPAAVKAFAIDQPRLWWPVGLGEPELEKLSGRASVDGEPSDQRSVRVGLREFTSSITGGRRLFSVNGRPLFLRGGGWASDLLLRHDSARLATELLYTFLLGLNMIRLEGKLESDDFYDRADENGIVLLPGWMCCDVWEKQRGWNDTHRLVARESMRSQAARLRNHPSVAAFLIGSDKAPPSDVAMAYTDALESVDWPNPIVHAASAEGDSGLKMPGPYDWVPPNYWWEDKTHGGAFGFNSEAGPGPAIPELDVMKTFMSPRDLDDLWTKPNAPQFHAGAPGRKFQTLAIFQRALRARFGAPTSLEDWVKKAQLMNYEAERAEFEAYAARKYTGTTGIVHWLLNSPWPSLIWHLYDWSLLPAAGFYGAMKANGPLHAVFAYDDRSAIVVNNTMKSEPNLSVVARVLDLESTERASEIFAVNVPADTSVRAGAVPLPAGLSGVHFVELELRRGPDVVSTNTYFIPEHEETLNYRATTWLYTPTTSYADLTSLMKVPPATVKTTMSIAQVYDSIRSVVVTLENTGKSLAFFLRVTLRRGAGGSAVPLVWDDNYVTLRPGAKRNLETVYSDGDLLGKEPVIEVEGVNVARTTAP